MPSDIDESLLADLRAFGQTLDSEQSTSILHSDVSVEDNDPVVEIPIRTVDAPSRRLRRPMLMAAAAVLLFVVGAAIWSTSNDSSFEIEPAHDADSVERTDLDEQTTEPDELTEDTLKDILGPQPATFVNPAGTPVGVYGEPSAPMTDQAIAELTSDDSLLGDSEATIQRLKADGLTIFTTFDSNANALADHILNEEFPVHTRNGFDVQIVTIETQSGAVTSLASTNKNNVLATSTELERQPGSAFKPFVLAALFEDGYGPNDVVEAGGPCSFAVPGSSEDYIVAGSYQEQQSVAAVTRSSNNCAFVRLGSAVGNNKVADIAGALGISTLPSNSGEFLSLPLGTVAVRPFEMAGAYATFANDGKKVTPHFVSRIEDRDGNVLFSRPTPSEQVVSAQTARMINDILESNVQAGTGRRAALDPDVAAGKTGTTNGFTDAWFIGYTGNYTTAIWVGDVDVEREIDLLGPGPFGGLLPAQIWRAYMGALLEDEDLVDFRTDYGNVQGGRLLEAENETS